MNCTLEAMVAEKGDLIYSYNKLNTHLDNLKVMIKAKCIKKQHKIMKENNLGSFLQKLLLLSLEIKRLNFEKEINHCKAGLANLCLGNDSQCKELDVLNERINMEKEALIKQMHDLKQQVYTIEKEIVQTADKVRNIANSILWQIELIAKLKKEYRTIFPKEDYRREKWEQELEKELRFLRPIKITHPPILLSKPKPPPQQIFVRMLSYPHAQSAKVAMLTACLNEPSIRYDKHLEKTTWILLNF